MNESTYWDDLWNRPPVQGHSSSDIVIKLKMLLTLSNYQDGDKLFPNDKVIDKRGLGPEHYFCRETAESLKAFQRRNGISVTGKVDKETIKKLKEMVSKKTLLIKDWSKEDRKFKLVPQIDDFTCWAAATAMLTNEDTVYRVIEKTPIRLRRPTSTNPREEFHDVFEINSYPVSDFRRFPGENGKLVNLPNAFAYYHNIENNQDCSVLYGGMWDVRLLCRLIVHSPILFMNAASNGANLHTDRHAIIIAAVVSDQDYAGNGTFFQIFNPSPVSYGCKQWARYNALHRNYAKGTNKLEIFVRKKDTVYPTTLPIVPPDGADIVDESKK